MKININKTLLLEVADDIANATGIDHDPETPEDKFSGKSALIGAGTSLGLAGATTVYVKRNAIKAGAKSKYNAVKTKAKDTVTGARQTVANKIYPEGPKNAAAAQAKYEKDLKLSQNVNEKLQKDNKTASEALKKAKADLKKASTTDSKLTQKTVSTVMDNLRNKAQNGTTK